MQNLQFMHCIEKERLIMELWAERDKYLNNLYLFWKDIYSYGRDPNGIGGEAHQHWANVFQEKLNGAIPCRILMLEPRFSLKTSFLQAVSLWWAFQHPNSNIFYIRKNKNLASGWILEIRNNIEHNLKLQSLFGEINDLKGKKWDSAAFNLKSRTIHSKNHLFEAFGMESGITGAHADGGIVILDDPADEEDTYSGAEYQKTLRFFQNLQPIIYNSHFIVVGTRWGKELYDYILNQLNPKAEKDHQFYVLEGSPLKTDIPVYEIDDLPDDPDLYRFKTVQKEHLIKNRDMGRKKWLANFFQKVIEDKSRIFKTIHYYKHKPEDLEYFMGVDTALGKENGDFSSIQVLAYCKQSKVLYHVESFAKRVVLTELIEYLSNFIIKYNIRYCIIEENLIADASLKQDILFRISERTLHSVQVLMRFIWFKRNKIKKEVRIESLEYPITKGLIQFPDKNIANSDDYKELYFELENFSSTGADKYDDCLDALEMAYSAFKSKEKLLEKRDE